MARITDEIDKKRVAAGVCRHCGGPIPCWSDSGDREVGKKHTAASLRKFLSDREAARNPAPGECACGKNVDDCETPFCGCPVDESHCRTPRWEQSGGDRS